jgi:two-component system sensor histidine kinase KdpD
MLSLVRREPDSFTSEETELAGLLGRLVASAVQNIRAYGAERKTVEELRRLSALRADFVSLVSHELRSPVASVSGAAQTLRQRWDELSPAQRETFFDLMEQESARLVMLVSEVLDTSMIEAGTFTYSFSEVDVGALVRMTARARDGQVRATVTDALPAVHGDAERLRQVLANLVENAVKYSPEGEPVEIRAYVDRSFVVVDVTDRGEGIAAADQALIFEKFGRAGDGVESKPGSGLGLFISRSIAEAHGGSLEVDSSPERGSTFSLSLPLAR